MSLSTDKIKKELAHIAQVSEKDLKRVSKSKNTLKQVERIFEIKNSIQTYVVVSDEKDEVILEIKKQEKSENLHGNSKSKISKMGSKYIFCLSKRFGWEENNLGLTSFQTITIVEKKFWREEQCIQDEKPEIIEYLPEYIGDLNESSVNEISFLPGETQLTDLEVIKDIESYGLKYSNELADFMEESNKTNHQYRKIGETYQ